MTRAYQKEQLEMAIKQLQQAKSAFRSGQAPRGVMLMLDGLGNAEETINDWNHQTRWKRIGDVQLTAGDGELGVYRDEEWVGDITAQGLYEAADLSDEQLSKAWSETKGGGDD